MNHPLRIGVIGIQGYGLTYFQTLEGNPDARITALCDINMELVTKTAAQYGIATMYTDYRELIADDTVDAVFVTTPHDLHYEMTMAALSAGKHVLCEKPLAITAKDAYEMDARASEKGLVLTCHYNRRQSAHVKLLKAMMNNRALGDVYAINLKWMARYTPFVFSTDSGWRVRKDRAGGGILIGRGSHMLDAALYLLDYPEIASVNARVENRLSGFDVDDYAYLAVRLHSGTIITVESAYIANIPHYKDKIEYELLGTKAGAFCSETDGITQCSVGYGTFPNDGWIDLSQEYSQAEYESAYPTSIIADFVDAVRNHHSPLVTGRQAALVTDILETAYRSSAERREIPLNRGGN